MCKGIQPETLEFLQRLWEGMPLKDAWLLTIRRKRLVSCQPGEQKTPRVKSGSPLRLSERHLPMYYMIFKTEGRAKLELYLDGKAKLEDVRMTIQERLHVMGDEALTSTRAPL